jgi:Mrp family chromosome partitioning ATPase
VARLAVMLARSGCRTLVVDLYLAKPRQARLLGIKPARGLADWAVSADPLDDYLWKSELGGLALLSCEPGKKPGAELLARRLLARMLPQLQNSWDVVLIDAPAIASCWDLALALPAGATLVITATRGATRAPQVIQTAGLARGQNWNLAGLVLDNC